MEEYIIPTLYKTKTPKEFSYPVGAEVISSAFQEQKEIKEYRLSFYSSHALWRKEYNEVEIFSISYVGRRANIFSSKKQEEENYYRQHWELRVNVVPRELRKTTKDVLVNHAFPLICNKLNTGYKEIRDFSLLKVVYYKNLNHFKFIGIVDGEKREEQILS